MRTLLLSLGFILVFGPSIRSSERLSMKVTPPVAIAPAGLIVRTIVERNPENRVLLVVAESSNYYRSSEMSLDGAQAPRVKEWVFRGLPAGKYEISATLVNSRGQRTKASQWFQAAPGLGE